MKHTHMILYRKNPDSVWKQDFFFGEEAARKTANRLFVEGFYEIELFARARAGWNSVKKVKQHELIAKAKQEAHIKALKATID